MTLGTIGAEVLGELGEDGGGGGGAAAADPLGVGMGAVTFWSVEHGGNARRSEEGRVGPVRHRGHTGEGVDTERQQRELHPRR